jgi:hypothetical protein
MPRFARYLGIDYSGAQTPTASLLGLRLYAATPARTSSRIRDLFARGSKPQCSYYEHWSGALHRKGRA